MRIAARPYRMANVVELGVPVRGEGLVGVRGELMLNRPLLAVEAPETDVDRAREDLRCGVDSEDEERAREEASRDRLVEVALFTAGSNVLLAVAGFASSPSCHWR